MSGDNQGENAEDLRAEDEEPAPRHQVPPQPAQERLRAPRPLRRAPQAQLGRQLFPPRRGQPEANRLEPIDHLLQQRQDFPVMHMERREQQARERARRNRAVAIAEGLHRFNREIMQNRPHRRVRPRPDVPIDFQPAFLFQDERVEQVFQDLVREFNAAMEDDSSGIGTDEEGEDEIEDVREPRVEERRAHAVEILRQAAEDEVLIGYLRGGPLD